MKIGIHNGLGWTQNWIAYCEKKNINYDLLNCYNDDIITQLKRKGISHLFWHFSHNSPCDVLMARNVIYSATQMGIKTFPNFNTCWHFDDKVSQKYLLEAVNAPVALSHVFYNQKEARNWLKNCANFPIVFKLRRGAGSYNVWLVRDYREGIKYANTMFKKGKHPTPGYLSDVNNKLVIAENISGFFKKIKKAPNFFKVIKQGKKGFPKEKGYVLFQDFIPGNTEDIRVSVIGDKTWCFKRKVRKNDFRASGSGVVDYSIKDIPIDLIESSHKLSKELATQSVAFDYVKDIDGFFRIIEISYGFVGEAVFNCPGYFNKNYDFINGHIWPEIEIMKNLLK